MKHTRGPWIVGGNKQCSIFAADDLIAATVSNDDRNGQADARLIAAAPDMLAALKALCDSANCPAGVVEGGIWHRALEAIAKAEAPK